jgi:hypothetical protein
MGACGVAAEADAAVAGSYWRQGYARRRRRGRADLAPPLLKVVSRLSETLSALSDTSDGELAWIHVIWRRELRISYRRGGRTGTA